MADAQRSVSFPATLWIDLSGSPKKQERLERGRKIRRELDAAHTSRIRLVVPACGSTAAFLSEAGNIYETISEIIGFARTRNIPVFLTALAGNPDEDRKNLLVAMVSELRHNKSSPHHELYECSGRIETWDRSRFLKRCVAKVAEEIFYRQAEKEEAPSSWPERLRAWKETPAARFEELLQAWRIAACEEFGRTDVTASRGALTRNFGTGQWSEFQNIAEQFAPASVISRLQAQATTSERAAADVNAIQVPPHAFFPELSVPPMALLDQLRELKTYCRTCHLPSIDGLQDITVEACLEDEPAGTAEPLETPFWRGEEVTEEPFGLAEAHAAITGMQVHFTTLRGSPQRRAAQREARRQLDLLRQRVDQAVEAECAALAAREDILLLHPSRFVAAYDQVYNSLLVECLRLFSMVWGLRYFLFFHLPQRRSLPSIIFTRRALFRSALGLLLPIIRLLNRYRVLYALTLSFRNFYRESDVELAELSRSLERLRQQTENIRMELDLQTHGMESSRGQEDITLASLRECPERYPQPEEVIEHLNLSCLDNILGRINRMVEASRQQGITSFSEGEAYSCFVPWIYQGLEAWRCAGRIIDELGIDPQVIAAYDNFIGLCFEPGVSYYSREETRLSGPLESNVILAWRRAALEQIGPRPRHDVLRASVDSELADEAIRFLHSWGGRTGFLTVQGQEVFVCREIFPHASDHAKIEFFQHRTGLTRGDLARIDPHGRIGFELACWYNWQMGQVEGGASEIPISPGEIYDRMMTEIPLPHEYYGRMELAEGRMLLKDTYSPILMSLFAAPDASACEPRHFFRTHFDGLLLAESDRLNEMLSLLLIFALMPNCPNSDPLLRAIQDAGFIP